MKKTTYVIDCQARGEDASDLIRWMRRNFGERGVGWDFGYASKKVYLEIWDPRFEVMWKIWKE